MAVPFTNVSLMSSLMENQPLFETMACRSKLNGVRDVIENLAWLGCEVCIYLFFLNLEELQEKDPHYEVP